MTNLFFVNGKVQLRNNEIYYERYGKKENIKDKFMVYLMIIGTLPISKEQLFEMFRYSGEKMEHLESIYNEMLNKEYIYEDINFNKYRTYESLLKISNIKYLDISSSFKTNVTLIVNFIINGSVQGLKRYFSLLLSKEEKVVINLIKSVDGIDIETLSEKSKINISELSEIIYDLQWSRFIYTEKL